MAQIGNPQGVQTRNCRRLPVGKQQTGTNQPGDGQQGHPNPAAQPEAPSKRNDRHADGDEKCVAAGDLKHDRVHTGKITTKYTNHTKLRKRAQAVIAFGLWPNPNRATVSTLQLVRVFGVFRGYPAFTTSWTLARSFVNLPADLYEPGK